jgi:hypothetical protein
VVKRKIPERDTTYGLKLNSGGTMNIESIKKELIELGISDEEGEFLNEYVSTSKLLNFIESQLRQAEKEETNNYLSEKRKKFAQEFPKVDPDEYMDTVKGREPDLKAEFEEKLKEKSFETDYEKPHNNLTVVSLGTAIDILNSAIQEAETRGRIAECERYLDKNNHGYIMPVYAYTFMNRIKQLQEYK